MSDVAIRVIAEDHARRVLNSIGGDLDDLGRRGSALGNILGGVMRTITSVGLAGALALGSGIVAGATSGLKASMELEQGLANVQAVLQATGEQAAQLKQLTVDLGLDPNLKVSTIEAAETMEILAKNGIATDDILNGVTRATILLANASGGDFAIAADVATSAMMMFNKTAADMDQVVNGVTGVLVASKFGIVDYEYALANAGGMLGALGVPLEDFNQLLAAVSPGFAKGATAGNSLKYMFSNLVPISQDATDIMKKLGIISLNTTTAQQTLLSSGIEPLGDGTFDLITQLRQLHLTMNSDLVPDSKEANKQFNAWLVTSGLMQNQFFDTNGEMQETDEILRVLRKSFGSLNDVDLTKSMRKIFGMEAAPAAIRLIRMTEEEWNNIGTAVNGADAELQAMIRNNTLEAKLEIWGDKLHSLKTLIGDQFAGSFRDLVEGATGILDEVSPHILTIYGRLAEGFTGLVPTMLAGLEQVANIVAIIAEQNVALDFGWMQGEIDWSAPELEAKITVGDAIDFSAVGGKIDLVLGQQARLTWDKTAGYIKASMPGIFDFNLRGNAQTWAAELAGVFSAMKIDNSFFFDSSALDLSATSEKINLVIGEQARFAWDKTAGHIKASLPGVFTFDFKTTASGWVTEIDSVFAAMKLKASKVGDSFLLDTSALDFTSVGDKINLALGEQFRFAWDKTAGHIKTSMAGVFDFDFKTTASGWVTELEGAFKAAKIDTSLFFKAGTIDLSWIEQQLKIELGNSLTYTLDVAQVVSNIESSAGKVRAALEFAYSLEGWAGVGKTIVAGAALALQTASQSKATTDFSTWGRGLIDSAIAGLTPTEVEKGRASSALSDWVGGIFDAADAQLESVKAKDISASLNTLIGSLTDAATKMDPGRLAVIDQIAAGMTGLTTSLMKLSSGTLDGIDTTKIADAISSLLINATESIGTALEPSKMEELGASMGDVVNSALTKAFEFIGDPELGKDLGFASGSAVAAVATGTAALVDGFATQLAATDWSAHAGSLNAFVSGFISGIVQGMADGLWAASIFNPETRTEVVSGITSGTRPPIDVTGFPAADAALAGFVDQFVMNNSQVNPGTGSPVTTRDIEVVRAENQANYASATASMGQVFKETVGTLGGVILNGILQFYSSVPAAGGLVMGAPLLSMGVPTIDVFANVVDVVVPTADILRPVVEVTAQVSELNLGDWAERPLALPVWTEGLAGLANNAPAAAAPMPELPAWPEYPTFPELPAWPEYPPFAEFPPFPAWPAYAALPPWPAYPAWPAYPDLPKWPAYPTFSWPAMPRFSWPDIQRPVWVSELRVPRPAWIDELVIRQTAAPVTPVGGNALGTSFWGGGWSWVGESGPELINMPRGASVLSNRDSMEAVGGVHITIHATVADNLDIEQLAYRVSDIVARKRR